MLAFKVKVPDRLKTATTVQELPSLWTPSGTLRRYKEEHEFETWLRNNVKGEYKMTKPYNRSWIIAFEDPDDAMMFKLTYL